MGDWYVFAYARSYLFSCSVCCMHFLVFLIAGGLVGCSLEPFSEDLDGEIKGLTVEGEVGIAPEVSMEGSHSNEIEFDVLVNGDGPKIASGSLVVANVTRYFGNLRMA